MHWGSLTSRDRKDSDIKHSAVMTVHTFLMRGLQLAHSFPRTLSFNTTVFLFLSFSFGTTFWDMLFLFY